MQKPQERNKVICCKPLIQDELQKISFNCHYEGLKEMSFNTFFYIDNAGI